MRKFTVAACLVLFAMGLAALIYVESAPSPWEHAARKRGCMLCHTDSFAGTPLPCLQQWQHGTALTPLVKQAMLAEHPTLPGDDADLLAHAIAHQQLPLLAAARNTASGAALYTAKCAICHGKNGEGQAGNYPPLQGSEWLTPSPDRPGLESIIRNGLQGPITVKGQQWNSTMLPPGITSDADVNALIDYLQQFR